MFESGERPRAVAIQFAVSAVVETQDIAAAEGGSGSAFRASLRAVGDRLHSRNQPFRRFLLPITGNQCPHDRPVAEFAGRRNDPRISHPKGRAKPLWRSAQDLADSVLAQTQLNPDLSGRAPEQIRMGFGVIADGMAARDSFFYQFWTFAHVSPDHKKCRSGIVAIQKIKQFWRDRWIWPVIEGNRQFARRICPANRGPEQLRAGIDCAVGGNSCRSQQRGGRCFSKPRIHAPIFARLTTEL